MSTAVSVQGVSKEFASRVLALDDVSLDVERSTFVSIIGPSGCGKSTLLRIIAGLTPATRGSVQVDGRPVDRPVAGTSMVFQTPVLLEWRTVLENVLFTAEMGGRGARKYRQRALQLLEFSGLKGFEHSLPYQISGGMQQRVALCRALLLDPSLILMDEPFGALDVITRERLGFELQRILSARKCTVVFVTHSVTEAVLLSDRIVVMTARPGHVREIIDIDLPRPRTVETMERADFTRYSSLARKGISDPS